MNQNVKLELIQQNALINLLQYLKDKHYQFTVVTPLTHQLNFSRKKYVLSGFRSLKDIFGWNLPFHPENLDLQLFTMLKDAQLLRIENGLWLSDIRVASLENDLFIHSAYPTTENDAVFFGPDTYLFYYHLKQYLTKKSRPQRSLEVCCGTSSVAICISKSVPIKTEILTVDINPKALFYSKINIISNKVDNVYPQYSDLFSNLEGSFDVVFANPPYLMDKKRRQYRHGGDELDGTALAFRIIKEGITKLTPDGVLFLYTGIAISNQGNKFLEALESLIQETPNFKYSYEEIDPDVFGEELNEPAYHHIERIAVVLIKIYSES